MSEEQKLQNVAVEAEAKPDTDELNLDDLDQISGGGVCHDASQHASFSWGMKPQSPDLHCATGEH